MFSVATINNIHNEEECLPAVWNYLDYLNPGYLIHLDFGHHYFSKDDNFDVWQFAFMNTTNSQNPIKYLMVFVQCKTEEEVNLFRLVHHQIKIFCIYKKNK